MSKRNCVQRIDTCEMCARAGNMADELKISVQFRYLQVFLTSVVLQNVLITLLTFSEYLLFFPSGGAELLFNKVKEHDVVLPKDENTCECLIEVPFIYHARLSFRILFLLVLAP